MSIHHHNHIKLALFSAVDYKGWSQRLREEPVTVRFISLDPQAPPSTNKALIIIVRVLETKLLTAIQSTVIKIQIGRCCFNSPCVYLQELSAEC